MSSLEDFSTEELEDELSQRDSEFRRLEDVSDYALENEIECRGYSTRVSDYDDKELLDELESRGVLLMKEDDVKERLQEIGELIYTNKPYFEQLRSLILDVTDRATL